MYLFFYCKKKDNNRRIFISSGIVSTLVLCFFIKKHNYNNNDLCNNKINNNNNNDLCNNKINNHIKINLYNILKNKKKIDFDSFSESLIKFTKFVCFIKEITENNLNKIIKYFNNQEKNEFDEIIEEYFSEKNKTSKKKLSFNEDLPEISKACYFDFILKEIEELKKNQEVIDFMEMIQDLKKDIEVKRDFIISSDNNEINIDEFDNSEYVSQIMNFPLEISKYNSFSDLILKKMKEFLDNCNKLKNESENAIKEFKNDFNIIKQEYQPFQENQNTNLSVLEKLLQKNKLIKSKLATSQFNAFFTEVNFFLHSLYQKKNIKTLMKDYFSKQENQLDSINFNNKFKEIKKKSENLNLLKKTLDLLWKESIYKSVEIANKKKTIRN